MRLTRIVVGLFFLITLPLAAQNATITGRVTLSVDGSAMPGVTVSVDELGVSTVTDSDGRYTLSVPSGRGSVKVTASLQGFQTRTATANVSDGSASQDFALRVSFGQEITVGSRAIGAEQEKAVPVDVIPQRMIESAPSTETNEIIEKAAPSFNFPRPTIADGTDSVRPATLRGLGPDQVLVMLNGKRRHVSALINVNNTVGRGSSGADLNAVPASALESVEILRDGAAAQYGSDAIAGVLNLVLKSEPAPIRVELRGGATTHGDGQTLNASVTGGWQVGRGAVFGTVEYRNRYETNRALPDPRDQVRPGDARNNAVSQPNTHWGDSYQRDIMTLANLNMPLSEERNHIVYGFGTFSLRHGSHGGNYRRAIETTNWPQIYPLGFLPLIEPRVLDQALTGGMRGQFGGWFYDASLGYGANEFDFFIRNTLNTSLGPTIPPNQTSFYAGSLADQQITVNADLSKPFEIGLSRPVNIAFGIEYRDDGYEITAGEPNSYIDGGRPNQFGNRATPGSQVFAGFRPSNEVDVSRDSKAIYVDVEGDVFERLRLGVALRYEDFSDFGDTTNGKVTARFTPVQSVILRGAVSTGFRAPSLGQSFFSTVSTNFLRDPVSGNVLPFEVGTFPVSSPVGRALGAQPLRPEESQNYSLGVVWQPLSNLEFTADYFRIDIEDRIVLSDNFNQPQVVPILAPFNATGARFFTNAIDTETEGYDLVANHQRPLFGGRMDLSAAYSNNKTEVVRISDTPPQLAGLQATLFGRRELRRAECSQPRDNIRLLQSYSVGSFSATARESRYGEYCSLTIARIDDQTFPDVWTTDLDLSYRWSKYTFGLGAENLFDSFPQQNLRAGTPSGSEQVGAAGVFLYPSNSPIGMNGRFVYTRVAYTF